MLATAPPRRGVYWGTTGSCDLPHWETVGPEGEGNGGEGTRQFPLAIPLGSTIGTG